MSEGLCIYVYVYLYVCICVCVFVYVCRRIYMIFFYTHRFISLFSCDKRGISEQ